MRQQQRKPNAEHHLAHHRKGCRFPRFAHCLQENETSLVYTGQNDHAEVNTERAHREIGIIHALIGSAEQGDELMRENLHQHQCHSANTSLGSQQLREQLFHAGRLPCAHVEANNGNAARRHADHDGDDDLKELHHNTHHGHGDLRILLLPEYCVQRTVFTNHIVDRRHSCN